MSNRPRVGSASSNRATSASQENKMLRDTINRLQQEVLHSKAETQRVSEQLSCLMLLVRRAWQGDQKAAVDVANIVGVAPPDFEEKPGCFAVLTATPKEPCSDPISVVMKSKSRALNNWALLTIGLLNREYKAIEEQLEARQQYYLHHRQAYLDEQLIYHRDLQVKVQAEMTREAQQEKIDKQRQVQQSIATNQQNVFDMIERSKQNPGPSHAQSLLKRSHSYTEGSKRRVKSASHAERGAGHTFLTQPTVTQPGPFNRPQSSKMKPTAKKALHRSASQQQTESNLTWADLVIDPLQNSLQQNGAKENGERSVYRLANPQPEPRAPATRAQRRISYDDPVRYNMEGLYDAENALGPGSSAFRNRPISAKAQRESDNVRSRPKSAVHAQGERQMKYEVVRPASAAVHSRTTKSASSNRRPPSGKKPTQPARAHPVGGKYSSVNGHTEQERSGEGDTEQGHVSDSDESQDTERVVYDQRDFEKLGIDLRELEQAERIPPMKINITKPQSVIDFERDVSEMHAMEKDIRKTTLALQKKLGISENGLI